MPDTAASGRQSSVEIKIANRFFDGLVLGFFQALGKLSRENIFLRAFRFHRLAKFLFDTLGLFPEQARRIVEINGRRRLRRRNVRENDGKFRVNCQLGLTAWAIDFD